MKALPLLCFLFLFSPLSLRERYYPLVQGNEIDYNNDYCQVTASGGELKIRLEEGLLPSLSSVSAVSSVLPQNLSHVYARSEDSRFTYYDPVATRSLRGFHPPYHFVNISTDALLSLSAARASDQDVPRHHYYYSGDLLHEDFQSLRSLIPFHSLFDNLSLLANKEGRNGMTGHVWLSPSETVAGMHYDAVYNLFLQIHGHKTLYLLPPYSLPDLKVYGRFHPFACQSREQLSRYRSREKKDQEDEEDFPYLLSKDRHEKMKRSLFHDDNHEYERVEMIKVELSPGDAFILPPYWFHKTVTSTASLSVTFWWECEVSEVFDEILQHMPLPLEEHWSSSLLTHHVFHYLEHFLAALATQTNCDVTVDKTRGSDAPMEMLIRLLHDRYLEDYVLHRSSSESNKISVENLPLEGEKKSAHYAKTTALQFIAGIILLRENLLEENVTEKAIPLIAEEKVEEMKSELLWEISQIQQRFHLFPEVRPNLPGLRSATNETDGRSRARRMNKCAILYLKACDYVEEVLYTAASLILPSQSSHGDRVHATVNLLLNYLDWHRLRLQSRGH
eukprot:scaffold3227_cov188-Ochromonas_danica.AAC.18